MAEKSYKELAFDLAKSYIVANCQNVKPEDFEAILKAAYKAVVNMDKT